MKAMEAAMGATAVLTGLLGFGPALLSTEGMSDEKIAGLIVGFCFTVFFGYTALHLSRFETDEDPAHAV